MLNNIPTTEKVITQVQCQACGKSMSAKNLTDPHAAYCIKRVQEVDKPKTTPGPNTNIPKLKQYYKSKELNKMNNQMMMKQSCFKVLLTLLMT